MVQLFGFEISRKRPKQDNASSEETNKSFALPQNDDGAVTIQSGAYYGTYVDLDGVVRNEIELITRYREMSMQPELETAVFGSGLICFPDQFTDQSSHCVPNPPLFAPNAQLS